MKQIFLFFHLLYSWDAEVASLADTWQPKESGKQSLIAATETL